MRIATGEEAYIVHDGRDPQLGDGGAMSGTRTVLRTSCFGSQMRYHVCPPHYNVSYLVSRKLCFYQLLAKEFRKYRVFHATFP